MERAKNGLSVEHPIWILSPRGAQAARHDLRNSISYGGGRHSTFPRDAKRLRATVSTPITCRQPVRLPCPRSLLASSAPTTTCGRWYGLSSSRATETLRLVARLVRATLKLPARSVESVRHWKHESAQPHRRGRRARRRRNRPAAVAHHRNFHGDQCRASASRSVASCSCNGHGSGYS